MVMGEHEGRQLDAGQMRSHFVQVLEPVELMELSPVDEHGRTMAAVARNMGIPAS
jgi:hypothetical protein